MLKKKVFLYSVVATSLWGHGEKCGEWDWPPETLMCLQLVELFEQDEKCGLVLRGVTLVIGKGFEGYHSHLMHPHCIVCSWMKSELSIRPQVLLSLLTLPTCSHAPHHGGREL